MNARKNIYVILPKDLQNQCEEARYWLWVLKMMRNGKPFENYSGWCMILSDFILEPICFLKTLHLDLRNRGSGGVVIPVGSM